MKPLLSWIFLRVLRATKNKIVLSLVFLVAGAFLSAWLDALTVMAVMMTACMAAKEILAGAMTETPEEKAEFDGFLRNLLMHGAVGTAVGGVSTLIGEPQNILIGHYAGWNFSDFYFKMAHISIPLQLGAVILCWSMERYRLKVFGFGYQFPDRIALTLDRQVKNKLAAEGEVYTTQLIIMAVIFVSFMFALAFQIAPIGIIGLGLLIIVPVLTRQSEEHQLGKAFHDSLPFTALLVVFFMIVAMLETQKLFTPVMSMALGMQAKGQLYAFFTASGILSSVSDNVFVASIYVHQAYNAFTQNIVDRAQFDSLCLVINAGTNIFSILTPNGQAAFLFLLTSALARKIELSYGRMFLMSLPYAVILIVLSYVMI
jgi:NhaB family Na+:H+ antiporter